MPYIFRRPFAYKQTANRLTRRRILGSLSLQSFVSTLPAVVPRLRYPVIHKDFTEPVQNKLLQRLRTRSLPQTGFVSAPPEPVRLLIQRPHRYKPPEKFNYNTLHLRLSQRIIPLSLRPPLAPSPPKVPLLTNRPHRQSFPEKFDYRTLQLRLKQRTVPISVVIAATPFAPPLRSALNRPQRTLPPPPSFDYRGFQLRLKRRFIPISIGISIPIPAPRAIFVRRLPRHIAPPVFNYRGAIRRLKARIIPLSLRPPLAPAPPKQPLKTNRPHRYIDPPEF
ncbi:hypothetical protein LCGC14_2603870, partial [marine sediment metagenome]